MEKLVLDYSRWQLDVELMEHGRRHNTKWHWTITLLNFEDKRPQPVFKSEGNGRNRLDAYTKATQAIMRYERGFGGTAIEVETKVD